VIGIIDTIATPVVFFVLGILATVLITIFFTIRKVLKIIIVPSFSLVDVSKEVIDKTRITYDKKPVDNLSSTTLKIRNSSFSGLIDKQVQSPLKIIFDNGIEILNYEIIEESFPGRNVKITIKNNTATIEKFTLLNKFEYIIIRFIHQGIGKNKIPNIKADIKDFKISQVEGMFKGKKESIRMLFDGVINIFAGMLFSAFSILLVYSLLSIGDMENTTFFSLLAPTVLFILFSILMFFSGAKKLYWYITCVIEMKIVKEKNYE